MSKMKNVRPPKWPDRLLSWYCSDRYFEEVQGDLHEWFYHRVATQGVSRARLMYGIDVLRYFRSFRLKSNEKLSQNSNYISMKQILKLTYRNLKKDPLSAFLRILNLTVGIGIFLLTFIYARYELNYDSYHDEPQNVYRIGHSLRTEPWAATPMGLGQYALDNFAEVESMTRFFRVSNTWIKYEDNIFMEKRGFFVDDGVFDLFKVKIISGDLDKALNPINAIILTETLAIKYFGRTDAIGELVELETDRGRPRQVTAVIEDIPEQSHLQFDFLLPIKVFGDRFRNAWRNWATYTYVRVKDGADLENMSKILLNEYEERYNAQGSGNLQPFFTPIQKIHLHTNHEKELADNGNVSYVYILLSVGAFVLLISSINFVNLSVVKGFDRSKEVGLRKTVGASRTQLTIQFLGENLLLLGLSGLFCLLLLVIATPVFGNFSGLSLPLNVLESPEILIPLILVIFLLLLICGVYPAMSLSKFKPVQVLKTGMSHLRTSKLGLVRRGLIIIQFVISIVLVVSSFVIYNQLTHIQEQNLGFEKDQIISIPVESGPLNDSFSSKFDVFNDALLRVTGVKSTTVSSSVPGTRIMVEGVQEIGAEDAVTTRILLADDDFVNTYGLEIINGKDFIKNAPDAPIEYILNESAANFIFQDRNPVNEMIRWSRDTGKVVGVVKDFNFQSLHHEVEPLVISSRGRNSWLSVRFEPASVESVRDGIERLSRDIYPDLPPIEYEFLSDRFENLYLAESRLRSLVWFFCIVSIVLTVSGIFGMATYMAKQRIKEIAIRKVLGSDLSNLLNLLSRDFLVLLSLALLIAIPAGVWLSNWWLRGFADKISVGAGVFIVSSLSIIVLVVASASYVTYRAASMNPVDALKND